MSEGFAFLRWAGQHRFNKVVSLNGLRRFKNNHEELMESEVLKLLIKIDRGAGISKERLESIVPVTIKE